MKGGKSKQLRNKRQVIKRPVSETLFAQTWHSEVDGYTISLNLDTSEYEFKLFNKVIGVHKWTKGMGEKGSMKALNKAVSVFNN